MIRGVPTAFVTTIFALALATAPGTPERGRPAGADVPAGQYVERTSLAEADSLSSLRSTHRLDSLRESRPEGERRTRE